MSVPLLHLDPKPKPAEAPRISTGSSAQSTKSTAFKHALSDAHKSASKKPAENEKTSAARGKSEKARSEKNAKPTQQAQTTQAGGATRKGGKSPADSTGDDESPDHPTDQRGKETPEKNLPDGDQSAEESDAPQDKASADHPEDNADHASRSTASSTSPTRPKPTAATPRTSATPIEQPQQPQSLARRTAAHASQDARRESTVLAEVDGTGRHYTTQLQARGIDSQTTSDELPGSRGAIRALEACQNTLTDAPTPAPDDSATNLDSGDADAADADASDASSPASPSPSLQSDAAPSAAASIADKSGSASAATAIGQSSFASFAQSLASAADGPAGKTAATAVARPQQQSEAAPQTRGDKFVAENHPTIVQSVKTQLLPSGGAMKMRLDPPEMGPLQVSVHVKDGVITASFQTSTDQATKMLSHSLGQLKTALESAGIAVGKIHVQQAAPGETRADDSDSSDDARSSDQNTSTSQQDQQRRETLQRMWERLALGSDPLDLVA